MDRMMDLYLNDPIVTLLFMKYGFHPQDDAAAEKASKHAAVERGHCVGLGIDLQSRFVHGLP
jgi:hypothetical protein